MTEGEADAVVQKLKNNEIVVMPTDTIYGICCLAGNQTLVERIYDIKGRSGTKPFIILIASLDQLEQLGCNPALAQKDTLRTYWPGPTSVVIKSNAPEYLTRGATSLAVRMPADNWLVDIISQTGPIVATSANISNQPYEHNLEKIQETIGSQVDYISTVSAREKAPSRIIDLSTGQMLR